MQILNTNWGAVAGVKSKFFLIEIIEIEYDKVDVVSHSEPSA